MSDKSCSNSKSIVFGILLALVLILLSCANIFHFSARMDSDVAAEAILAKEISDNHLKTPDTWVISTETRYIYPANLAAPLYGLTGNMQLSMGLAATVCGLILVLAMFLLHRKIGLSTGANLMAVLIPFVISVNIHDSLEMFFMYAGYYFPVLLSFYVTLYVYVMISEKKSRPIAIVSAVVLSLLLAAVLGAQGMRGVLMTYLPVLSAHILKLIVMKCKRQPWDKRQLPLMAWLFVLTAVSAVVCKLCASGVSSTSRNLRHGFEKLFGEVIPAVTGLFTVNSNPVLTVIGVPVTVGALIYSIYLLFFSKKFSDDSKWMTAASLWAGGFVMVAAMAFTTFEVAPRYGIYFLFAAGMATGLLTDRLQERAGDEEAGKLIKGIPAGPVSLAISIVIILCAVMSVALNYKHLIKDDNSADSSYHRIAAWMQEKGTDTGYAVFDYAGDMTVTCNGPVSIYPVNNMSDMEGCKWLANSDWYPPYADSERSVVVITTDSTDADFCSFMAGNDTVQILDTTNISRFNCYFLGSDPVRWSE